jgi:hypothetical protein
MRSPRTQQDLEQGILGFESAGKGQQVGHLVVARVPHWDGFVQCDTCNLPRQYEHALTGAGGYRVDRAGEHSCRNCRRRRYVQARPWYPITIRVFAPAAKQGDFPQRVIPLAEFERAWRNWPLHHQAASRNAWLRGYADQRIDRPELYTPAGAANTPYGDPAQLRGTSKYLAETYNRGRGRAFFTAGALEPLRLPA